MKKSIRILGATSAVLLLYGFIPGGARNTFINGTRTPIKITYRSTAVRLDTPVLIKPGAGLRMTGDCGDLLRLLIIYPDGRTLSLSTREIRRIENSSKLYPGVWWITTAGVEYISTKESLARTKAIFGRW